MVIVVFVLGLQILSERLNFISQGWKRTEFLLEIFLIMKVIVQIIVQQTVITVNVVITVISRIGFLHIIKHSKLMNNGHIRDRINLISLYSGLHYVHGIGIDDIGVSELYVELIA